MYTEEENSQTTKPCTLMAASLQASSSTGTSKSMKNQQHSFKGFNTCAFKNINTCGPSYEVYYSP
jgi:hypothetical protein